MFEICDKPAGTGLATVTANVARATAQDHCPWLAELAGDRIGLELGATTTIAHSEEAALPATTPELVDVLGRDRAADRAAARERKKQQDYAKGVLDLMVTREELMDDEDRLLAQDVLAADEEGRSKARSMAPSRTGSMPPRRVAPGRPSLSSRSVMRATVSFRVSTMSARKAGFSA